MFASETSHPSATAPLKLRPYGDVEIRLLLLLLLLLKFRNISSTTFGVTNTIRTTAPIPQWLKVTFIVNNGYYPARSAAVDDWNVEWRKRLGAVLLSLPVVVLQFVETRVASDPDERRRSGAVVRHSRLVCSPALLSVVVHVVIVVIAPCTRTAAGHLHRHAKICKRYRKEHNSIDQSYSQCFDAVGWMAVRASGLYKIPALVFSKDFTLMPSGDPP